MKRNLAVLLLTTAMALSLFGCMAQNGAISSDISSSQSPSELSSSSAVQANAFPVTLTDAAGREVIIDKEPERLVSGYYISTSMLIALGQNNKLVGIEAKADKRPIYSLAAAELQKLPNVGTAKEFDLEGCAALKPDLAILPIKLKDIVPALEQLGITALLVNPENIEQLEQTITLLGKATGAIEQANSLLAYNKQASKEISGLLSNAKKPSVYLAGNSSYLNTAGAKMYQNTLIQMGGGVNVAQELEDSYWAAVSYEQLLAWNPEVIVIAAEADYTKEDFINDKQLAQLEAVKNGRVYAMPSAFEAWDSPIPGAMLGSRWMASVLHDELYPFDTFKQDAADFYNTFYGIEIDQTLVTK